MAKISKEKTSQVEAVEGFEGHYEDLGGYTVGFETYEADMDPATLFRGLPNDRCQCPHWGYVLRGRAVFRYDDGTEDVISAGEAYYAKPGHLPLLFEGTDVVEFSPTADLAKTIEVITANARTADTRVA